MKKGAEKQPTEGKISSIIFLILNIILGVFTLIIGIMAIFYEKYLFVVLYILLGVFAFLPRKIIKISNWKKFLIGVGIFILISTMSIFSNWNLNNNGNDNFVNNNMQEKFILNTGDSNLSMIVYNTTKEESILVNGQEKTTTGYFLRINCEITNLGISPVLVDPGSGLIDSQNQTYASIGFSLSQEYLQPDLAKQCYFVFELPDSAQGIKFRIRDESAIHVIDLGM